MFLELHVYKIIGHDWQFSHTVLTCVPFFSNDPTQGSVSPKLIKNPISPGLTGELLDNLILKIGTDFGVS